MEETLEQRAKAAYNAFLQAAEGFLPPIRQTWEEMHPVVQKAWKAAVVAASEAK